MISVLKISVKFSTCINTYFRDLDTQFHTKILHSFKYNSSSNFPEHIATNIFLKHGVAAERYDDLRHLSNATDWYCDWNAEDRFNDNISCCFADFEDVVEVISPTSHHFVSR